MKRYTQGFKYFGPMEQSNDGEWVRFEEAKDFLRLNQGFVEGLTELLNNKDELISSQTMTIQELNDCFDRQNDLCKTLIDEGAIQDRYVMRLEIYLIIMIAISLGAILLGLA